jgi:branched-chain amino acid transport system ATP-binding protein
MGKTTLLRSVMGLLSPVAGTITFRDVDLVRLAPFEIARLGIAIVPQGRRIFPSLRVEEHLTVAANNRNGAVAGTADWTADRIFDLFPGLEVRRRNFAGNLSGGEQQMLAIARSLMTNPQLVLMDEPSEGLAPIIVERLQEVISSIVKQGVAVLLVEQNLRLGLECGDRVHILSKGQVVWGGDSEELERDVAIQKRWLGV